MPSVSHLCVLCVVKSTLKLYIHSALSSCTNGLRFPRRSRPTHSRDASMGFVVMMERGWQWPDLEGLLPWRPLEGAKSSCRQSADALWVNPFKHDLLTSLFIYFSLSREKAPHDAQIATILYPVRGCRWKAAI